MLIAYRQFALRPYDSPTERDLQVPNRLLWAGEGGAVMLSGGDDHYADVRVTVWPAKPARDTSKPWVATEEGVFATDVPTMVLEGATGRISDARIRLPAPGRYGIRAQVVGREEAAKVDISDGQGFPSGLEHWLLEIWPAG